LLAILPEHIRWYNHFHAARIADRKLYQLRIARDCGLPIPRTLVTSCPQDAIQFVRQQPKTIFKSFAGSKEVWQPTRLVTEAVIESLFRVALCPVIFQEYVTGDEDYRVTVIDDDIQTVRFHT